MALGKVPFWKSFGRAQVAAVITTCVDYGTFFFSVEILKVWYVAATAIGALLGACTNFTLNRFWSFEATHRRVGPQAKRYALVSGGSLCLNMIGIYAFTEGLGLKYGFSKIATSITVALLFNFPLQRHYVFK